MQRECRWQRDVGTRTRQEGKASSRVWLLRSNDRDKSWRAWGESSPHLDTTRQTGGQRLRSQQTQVNALFLASHQSVRGSEALSVALTLIQHQFYLHFVQKLQWRKFKSLLCPLCYHFKVSFYSNNAQELNLKLQRFPGVTKSWMASKQEQFIQTRCLFSTLGQIRAGTFSWPINMPADRKLFWSFSKLECQIFSCSSQSLSSSFCVFKCSWLNLCISHMFTLSPVGHLK